MIIIIIKKSHFNMKKEEIKNIKKETRKIISLIMMMKVKKLMKAR